MVKKPSWKRYKGEIESYGYRFSIRRFSVFSITFLLLIVGFGVLYKLDYIYILFVCMIGIVCLPIIIKSGYKKIYEAKRFSDLSLYLEQMCASFNKQSKILSALKDTSMVSEGRLKNIIISAVTYIEKGLTTSDSMSIYEEALKPMEEAFKCKRLLELHRFLIKIEIGGGDYKVSLNSLLKDIHSWVERTYILQREKKSIRLYFAIGIIISAMVCGTGLLLVNYVDITDNIAYKLITTIFLSLGLISFTIMEVSLSGSWIDNIKNDELILSEYRTALYSSTFKIRKKMIPLYLVVIVLSTILLVAKSFVLGFSLMFFLVILLIFPSLRYKKARDSTLLEIKYSFSEWLRNIAVNLQHHTVQMALQESYENAPIIIKEPLKKLLWEISEDPNGATPYFNFLKEFNLHEVASAMKMLYSLTQLGADDVSQTLDALMNRNFVLIEKVEKEISENRMVYLKQLVSAPLLFAGVKIVVDMLIFIMGFLANMGNLGEYIN